MDETSTLDPTTWIDQHADALYRFALLRVGDADRATDLVQETLLDALRSLTNFQGKSSERSWLIGILKHKIFDEYRKRSRMPKQGIEPDEDVTDSSPYFTKRGTWTEPPMAWPDDSLERAEFWDALFFCLAGLPANLSRPFVMREVDGLETDEVCKLCEITPTNLWVRLHRARLALRGCLQTRWLGGADEGP